MAYIFQDYYDEINGDIKGDDYIELINSCFSYSYYFSLVYKSNSLKLLQLDRFLYRSFYSDCWPGTISTSDGGIVKIYLCNEDSKKELLSISDSIFSWNSCFGNQLPEDMAFYRKDGTVFFESIVHEGECLIFNNSNEAVRVINKEYWRYSNIEEKQKFFDL